YDPSQVRARHQAVKKAVAVELKDIWQSAYAKLPITAYEDTAEAMGVRAWRNVVLDMALLAGVSDAKHWA
ncbi:aminopeptidase N C-terminal domain-containing protein, partial [Escherichia coli]|nr:aminopeptidase N C-terminal domain-containing protein [Escherichia coli]